MLEGQKLFPGEEQFLTVCRMGWSLERGDCAEGPDGIVLVAAELDRVRERYNGGNRIEDVLADESLAWLYLLAGGYEDPKELGRMAESFPTMEEFAERYGIAIGDPDLKRKYDVWWQSEMEYNSMVSYARREGREAGLEEGYAEGFEIGRAVAI